MGAFPTHADGHLRGPNASDVWTMSCATGTWVVFHYDGSMWRSIAPAHSGSCNDGTGNGADVIPAGNGTAWFTSASTLVRIHADGTIDDFATEVPASTDVQGRAIGAFGDTVFATVRITNFTSELYVLRDGHFTDAGMLPFILTGSVLLSSANSGIVPALTVAMSPDPSVVYARWARWDGTTLTLPTVGPDDPWYLINPMYMPTALNSSFRTDDLWMTDPMPTTSGSTGAELFLTHWDGTAWHSERLPRPTAPDGSTLSLLTLVHTATQSLVAIGATNFGYDLSHDPAGIEYGDATFWGQAWNGSAWVEPRNLGTLQRCAGPNCSGETGPVADSVMGDGSIITGNGGGNDSNTYVLRYE
jgi:hypothetical protein